MNTDSRAAFNSIATVGIIFQLADGSIQSCNREAERILGYTARQLIAADYFAPPWQTIHQDGSIFPAADHPGIISLKTGKPCSDIVMGFSQPDEQLVWLLVETQPLFQGDNLQPYAVVVSFIDLKERPTEDLAIAALETTRSIQNRESKQFKLLAIEDNPEDLEMYRRYLQKDREHQYTFVTAESGEEALAIVRDYQPDLILLDYLLPDMDGLEWLSLWQEQQRENPPPVIVLTGQGDESVAVRFLKSGAADYLVKGQLTPEKLSLEVNRAIAEYRLRLQHQETLLKLQLATVASGVGLWFWDLINDKLEWTKQCKTLFGLDADTEITYQLFLDCLHPEDRDRTNKAVSQALNNKTEYNIEYRVIWSDDSIHWIAAKGKGFYNQDGAAIRMMGTTQDISDRKNVEQSLVKSNQRITDILESMTDAFYTLDRDFNFIYVNQEAQRVLRKPKEHLLGRNLWSEFPSVMGTELERHYRQALAQQTATRFEYYYPSFDRWYEICVYPSVRGLSIYFRDITDSKLGAIKLQENERLLKLALSSAKAGSWDWDISTNQLIWSTETYELYGIDPDKETLEYSDWAKALHPEDREKSDRELKKVLWGQSSELRIEFRIIHPEKGIRWLSGIGNVTRNANGEPLRMSGINLDITERKQIEEEIKNSERHLRRVLDSLFSFVGVMTPDGILIEANRTVLEAANLQPEDVINQPFAETYWWSYDPQIQAQLTDAIARAAQGENVHYDVKIRLGKDNYILIEFSLIPLFDAQGKVEYLIPSGIDISDREASKQALKESEDELRLITEVIPQQIWTALPNGQVDYINRRWEQFTGRSLPQMQAKGWEIIVHPDDLERVQQTWTEAVHSGKKYNIEARLRKSDGTYRWFLGSARPLRNKKGKIIKWYGTNTDITPIKELEERLRQQTEDLTQANRLKDEFLAIVSHELRTPLNPILGWSQLIAAGRLSSEKVALGIETIRRNAKLQAQLIDDLLDVSRILRGKLDLKVTPLNLESVIRAALGTVQLAANAKSIQIETQFEPNIGQVSGDAGRLQQIVWNLLSNAIKFTPEGGRIAVRLKQIDTQALIQVEDTGQGIEPDFLPYVFDRFRQAESATTRKFGGLGLGLAIVRHLTEIHGGTVSVTSPGEGKGATFSVKLPLMNRAKTEQPENEPLDETVQPDRFKNIRILAIDDEVDSRDLLILVLQQEGAEVIPVASASAALETLKQVTPDLIISDIGMPQMDGYTMMAQIRQLPQGKNIPAIALTAYAGEVDRQRSLDVGFQKHISKPINISEFINIISQLISAMEDK
ncbi:MAG: hypothetical protein Tsb0014_15610 [Pleurocapsa sp.]